MVSVYLVSVKVLTFILQMAGCHKWKKEQRGLFFDSLNPNAILDLNNRLTEFASSDLQGIDQEKIYFLVFDCNKIMLDAAYDSGMFVNIKQKKNQYLGLLLAVMLSVGTISKPEIFTTVYAVLKIVRI